MYVLMHQGEAIGHTKFESSNPKQLSVSGVFHNMGGAKALAGWLKSIGGKEDDGVVFITLQEDFALFDESGDEIKYAEASLIAVPEQEETYLEITLFSEEQYKTRFANHVASPINIVNLQ